MLNTAKLAILLAAVLILPSCKEESSNKPQVIVLGFDGLVARLMRRMLDENRFTELRKAGRPGRFQTTGYCPFPRTSPVAWSSIITGTDPGKHGIFELDSP